MVTRLAAGLAASFLLMSAELSAAVAAWTDVVVRVYDTTGLAGPSQQRALTAASTALVTASVDVVWIDCAARSGACEAPPAPRELIVRLVNGRAPADRERLSLGDAFVGAGAHRGVLATVYVDRVRRLAATLSTDEAVLLGRAIAHELGHLLTGTGTHARVGLMRGKWTWEEIRRERREDWRFGAAEAARIRARAKFEVRGIK